MRALSHRFRLQQLLLIPLVASLALAGGCRVEQERAGEAPEVDVDVDPGRLPEYEVEGPDVNVGTEEVPVTVPEVQIEQREETVEVPTVEIEPPSADPNE